MMGGSGVFTMMAWMPLLALFWIVVPVLRLSSLLLEDP